MCELTRKCISARNENQGFELTFQSGSCWMQAGIAAAQNTWFDTSTQLTAVTKPHVNSEDQRQTQFQAKLSALTHQLGSAGFTSVTQTLPEYHNISPSREHLFGYCVK